MEKDKEITEVIFRKFRNGDVIAMFPALASSCHNQAINCLSYMHVGQHSEASLWLVYDTRPAKEDEYASLYSELESIGYRLKVVKRFTPKHKAKRLEYTKTGRTSPKEIECR